MATEPRTSGLTYEDRERMFPDEDIVRRELIGGELIVSPSPSTRHQRVVVELTVRLHAYAREHGGEVYAGPLDVYFTEHDVVEPDVLFVRPEHLARLEQRFVRGAPDLVVEVSSPSTRRLDLTRKRELYERHRVPEYWFVDLEADRVEVYRGDEGRYGSPGMLGRREVLETPLLPGFSLPVDELLSREA